MALGGGTPVNSDPPVTPWLLTLAGGPCVDGWMYGRVELPIWGACVVLKATTGTAENDQEGPDWPSERQNPEGRCRRFLPYLNGLN